MKTDLKLFRENLKAVKAKDSPYVRNDFIDIGYLEYKDEELSKLLDRRCWWVYKMYLDCLEPLVKSDFLYKRIEGVEK